MKEIKQIFVNSVYLIGIQGLNYILPLFTLPYLIYTLSADSFGIYSFSLAFCQITTLIIDFGFNLSATKRISENSENISFLVKYFWNIIFIKFIFLLIIIILTGTVFYFTDVLLPYRNGIYITFLMAFGFVIFPTWWFQGLNKIKILSLINALSKLLIYPLIFVFVRNENDVYYAIVIHSSSFVLTGILSFLYILKDFRYFFNISYISVKDIKNEILNSWPLFLSNSSISLYTNSLTLLLGFFSSQYLVGVFGAMEKMVRTFSSVVLNPIIQATFPIITKSKMLNYSKAIKIFQSIFVGISLLLLLIYTMFFIFKTYIFEYFFYNYIDFKNYLLILMLAIFPIALGGVCGQLGLLALGDNRLKNIFSKIYIYCGIFSLPLSILLIYKFQLIGTIISMMFVEYMIFFILVYFVVKNNFLNIKIFQ